MAISDKTRTNFTLATFVAIAIAIIGATATVTGKYFDITAKATAAVVVNERQDAQIEAFKNEVLKVNRKLDRICDALQVKGCDTE